VYAKNIQYNHIYSINIINKLHSDFGTVTALTGNLIIQFQGHDANINKPIHLGFTFFFFFV